MKKLFAILMMAATLAACSNELQPAQEVSPKTYTLTIQASKDDDATKALAINDSGSKNVLNATWAVDDVVTAYNVTRSSALGGSLTAQSAGSATTLSGTLTGDIYPDDVLTLKYLSPNYSSQTGTLDYIADNCDYAEATVTVESVESGVISIVEVAAHFLNKQAIIKFSLKDESGAYLAYNPTSFTINDGTSDIVTLTSIPATTYTTNGENGVLYVAVPAITDKKLELTAVSADKTRIFHTTSTKTFAIGKYYEIGVKLYPTVVSLTGKPGSSVYLKDGQTLTGTLTMASYIYLAAGATLTLDDVTISGGHTGATPWAGLTCMGDATIILNGDNTVNGFDDNYPGIQAGPVGTTLTIMGAGSLSATGSYAPGIGSVAEDAYGCGDIVINGGSIVASGGDGFGPGIGAGIESACGTITINDGDIKATGSFNGAGIGGADTSICDGIIINGGIIAAIGGEYAPGIGAGASEFDDSLCGDIIINGGDIEATGGDGAAGIGAGYGDGGTSICENITIGAGVTMVIATKGAGSATESIGKGDGYSECGTVTIEDPSKVALN